MAAERKRRLFEDVLRLRRAERAAPRLRDIVTVRARLEEELGDTVSQRLAAELVGVSQTGLRRWVDRGDVPLVYAPSGRLEVPLPVVLRLREAVDAERAHGGRRRHLLEPTLREAHAPRRPWSRGRSFRTAPRKDIPTPARPGAVSPITERSPSAYPSRWSTRRSTPSGPGGRATRSIRATPRAGRMR